MFRLIEKIWTFLSYWYFRYSLVTELYMVEKWERHVIHGVLFTMFGLLFLFNYRILLPSASQMLMYSSIQSPN